MVFRQERFLVSDLGQNIYRIYFSKVSKVKYLRNVIFTENDKFLETSFIENRESFYYFKFNLKDTSLIIDENIFQFIKPLVGLSNTKSDLSLIYFNIEILSCRLIRIQHKP